MKKIILSLIFMAIAALCLVTCKKNPPQDVPDYSKRKPAIELISASNWFNCAYIEWSYEDGQVFKKINIYKEDAGSKDFWLIAQTSTSNGMYMDENSQIQLHSERYYITGITSEGIETVPSDTLSTVYLTIRRMENGWYELSWNAYEDDAVVSYEIMRGEDMRDPANKLASVEPSVTRFVDRTPNENQPYYMIQYMMPWRHKIRGKYSTSPIPEWEYGQSNIVDCREL